MRLREGLRLEMFLSQPREKQERVIEAGLRIFGKRGYKKASVRDIAAEADISKGMFFHFFGSKKGMYLYLMKISCAEVADAFEKEFDPALTDYFDRILMLTNCKMRCLKKHPSLLSFFTSLYLETDPEVMEEVEAIKEYGKQMRVNSVWTDDGREKFKDPGYAELTWNLLMGYGESCVNSAAEFGMEDLAKVAEKFEACVHMLKQNLYKEAYLK